MNYDTNNTTVWTKNMIVTFPKLQPRYDFNQLKLLIIKITGYSFQAVVIYVGKYFLHLCNASKRNHLLCRNIVIGF